MNAKPKALKLLNGTAILGYILLPASFIAFSIYAHSGTKKEVSFGDYPSQKADWTVATADYGDTPSEDLGGYVAPPKPKSNIRTASHKPKYDPKPVQSAPVAEPESKPEPETKQVEPEPPKDPPQEPIIHIDTILPTQDNQQPETQPQTTEPPVQENSGDTT